MCKSDHYYFLQADALLSEENYDKLLEIKVDGKPYNRFHRNESDLDRVNISEEVSKTGIWMQLNRDNKNGHIDADNGNAR